MNFYDVAWDIAFAFLGFSFSWIYFWDKLKTSEKRLRAFESLNESLKQKLHDPKIQTQDLKDFLTDLNNHNYGFVRVDPNSVFHRSPR